MRYAIKHQAGIKASPDEVYAYLTEAGKLAQWWTKDTRGDGSRTGGKLEFWFGDFCQVFTVTELRPGERVVWKSPKDQGADAWEGTEISFDLSTDKQQTFVLFQHAGWRESSDFMGHCSMKWAMFMLSLKEVLENGQGRPYPQDIGVRWY